MSLQKLCFVIVILKIIIYKHRHKHTNTTTNNNNKQDISKFTEIEQKVLLKTNFVKN